MILISADIINRATLTESPIDLIFDEERENAGTKRLGTYCTTQPGYKWRLMGKDEFSR